jgi:hypothetical protein
MTFGTVRLGQETSQALAGQAELFGGTSGTAFRNLVLSGKLDPEWAKEFFAK